MDQKNNTSSQGNSAPVNPLFLERMKRMQDVVQLKQPDRIPINLPMKYMLAEIGGITKQELQENPDKAQEIKEKVALELQPDMIVGSFHPIPGLTLR